MYVTEFKVRGSGTFPADMLRYDRAFPWGREDVDQLWSDRGEETRTVRLGVHHSNKFHDGITNDRWASFGWDVIDVAPVRKV